MPKISVDKKQKLVVFKCKTEEEMAYVLELYEKGAEQHRKEVIKKLEES